MFWLFVFACVSMHCSTYLELCVVNVQCLLCGFRCLHIKHSQQIVDVCATSGCVRMCVNVFQCTSNFVRLNFSLCNVFTCVCTNRTSRTYKMFTKCVCRVWLYLHAFECRVFELVETIQFLSVRIPDFCLKHPNYFHCLTSMS